MNGSMTNTQRKEPHIYQIQELYCEIWNYCPLLCRDYDKNICMEMNKQQRCHMQSARPLQLSLACDLIMDDLKTPTRKIHDVNEPLSLSFYNGLVFYIHISQL